MIKQGKLKKLHEEEHKKCKCKLKNQCTQAVFSHGNVNSEIVFIGEAPGKDEDLKGEPFEEVENF